MPAPVVKKHSRSRRGARHVRGDGGPRLVAPGSRGNPFKDTWALLYNERVADRKQPGKFKTRSKRLSTEETDEDAARAFLVRWQNARGAPKAILLTNDILDGFVAWKRAEHRQKGRSPRLAKNIESALREVRAHFGPLPPSQITFAYQQDYIERRRKMEKASGGAGKVGDRTISIELAYLRGAFKRAEKTNVIPKGSAPYIELPVPVANARERVLDKDERKRLLDAVRDPITPAHMRALVVIALFTGQRGIHIRHLRWEHVDFGRGVLWFRRSNPNAARNKSCEDVLMGAPLAALLRAMKEDAVTPYVIEFVARKADGSLAKNVRVGEDARPVGSMKRAWRSLMERAHIEGANIHDLRRSFTSSLYDEGAELRTIADFMGVSVKTLRRHYAFSSPERHKALLAKIEESAT